MAVIESDSFIRLAVSSGFGTSTNGDSYYNRQGAAASLLTTGSQGKIVSSASARSHVTLGVTTYGDQENYIRITPSNASDDFGIDGRMSGDASISGVNGYRASVAGSTLTLARIVSGTATTLTTSAKSFTAGLAYWAHMLVTGAGPVRIRVRVWPDGQGEPTSWDIDYTDSSGSAILTGAPGMTGIATNATGIAFDNFLATDTIASTNSPTAPTATMQLADLQAQYARIKAVSTLAPKIRQLAIVYFSAPSQSIITGELAAWLYQDASINNLHVMQTISDVNTFIATYS